MPAHILPRDIQRIGEILENRREPVGIRAFLHFGEHGLESCRLAAFAQLGNEAPEHPAALLGKIIRTNAEGHGLVRDLGVFQR